MLIDAATLHDLDVLTASTPRGQVKKDVLRTAKPKPTPRGQAKKAQPKPKQGGGGRP